MKFRNTIDGYLLLREYVAEDGYVHAEIWGRPNDVEMHSEPTDMSKDGSEWFTYKVEKDGEVLFDGVLHKDSYEPLVNEKEKEIPHRTSQCPRRSVAEQGEPAARLGRPKPGSGVVRSWTILGTVLSFVD